MKIHYFFFVFIWFISIHLPCYGQLEKSSLSVVYELAGDNKDNLEEVLTHYKNLGEDEKYKAAAFLISNMARKYGNYYSNKSWFLPILKNIPKWNRETCNSRQLDKIVGSQINQVPYEVKEQTIQSSILDCQIITSEFLIENIDLAFKVWKEKPWASHLNFNQFCEYILPYRINNEPLQNWRPYFLEKFKGIEDSVSNPKDIQEVCRWVNTKIAEEYIFCNKLGSIPSLGLIDAWNTKSGVCNHRYALIIGVMRSLGIPIASDFSPLYSTAPVSHSWVSLLDADMNFKPFNGGEKEINFEYPAKCPIGWDKMSIIYRTTYAENPNSLVFHLDSKNIPPSLRNIYSHNITSEYNGYKTRSIEFDLPNIEEGKVVYVFGFERGMTIKALTHSAVKNNKIKVDAIGVGGVYWVALFKENRLIPIQSPFILPANEGKEIRFLEPDFNELETVHLVRKYFPKYTMEDFIYELKGAEIQASNDRDFKKYATVFSFVNPLGHYVKTSLKVNEKYKYYRFNPAKGQQINLAELSFFIESSDGKEQNISGTPYQYTSTESICDPTILSNLFDSSGRTNYIASSGSWVGIELEEPKQVSSFAYLVRNHWNIIEPNHIYELFYLNNNRWESLKVKKAEKFSIQFNNVPKNALLLLKNLTEGKEERIFLYQNDKQDFGDKMFYY